MIVGSTREYSEYTIGYGKSREGSNRTTTTVTDLLPYSTATVDKDYLLLFVLGVDCVEVHGVGEVSLKDLDNHAMPILEHYLTC